MYYIYNSLAAVPFKMHYYTELELVRRLHDLLSTRLYGRPRHLNLTDPDKTMEVIIATNIAVFERARALLARPPSPLKLGWYARQPPLSSIPSLLNCVRKPRLLPYLPSSAEAATQDALPSLVNSIDDGIEDSDLA